MSGPVLPRRRYEDLDLSDLIPKYFTDIYIGSLCVTSTGINGYGTRLTLSPRISPKAPEP